MSLFTIHRSVMAFSLLASTLWASPGGPPRLDSAAGFEGMRERWAGLMYEFDVPGMAVAIVKDGKLHAIETFGVRAPENSASTQSTPTPDTIYYIASITKTYLATAICALADEGKLSLDDPVEKYLPKFTTANPGESAAPKITLRDLLSHKAGINGGPIVMLDAFTGEITDDRYYHWLGKLQPTGRTSYSNIHYTLLGRVIEAVSGKTWRDYLDQRVFQPAGLTRTTGYASRMYGDADCALPMEQVDGKWQVCPLRKTDRTMHAAGGLGASANDAARWLILHLNDGEIDGKRIISAERAKEMRTLQGKLSEKQGSIRIIEGFGLGWQVGTFHGTQLCSHGGGYAGTAAYYAMLPEKKCGFAVLMNAGGAARGLQDVMAIDILDRLIEGDKKEDVLAPYRSELATLKDRMNARMAQRKEQLAKPFDLSKPASAYEGRFENDVLGTVTIAAEGERLKATAGDCELDITADGTDAFRALGPAFEDARFKFPIDKGNEITSLSVEVPELGTFEFKK